MDKLVLPDYGGACISNIVPALLDGSVDPPSWMPDPAIDAGQVVLLVLDGLGWEQLQDRRHLAPTLSSMLDRVRESTGGVSLSGGAGSALATGGGLCAVSSMVSSTSASIEGGPPSMRSRESTS